MTSWNVNCTKVRISSAFIRAIAQADHSVPVSTPDHYRYGEHLSFEEVNELVKPTDETLYLVHEWLFANGVSLFDYSPAKDWINIYLDVESAERLLDTEYSVFEHDDGTRLIRTSEWSLPQHLHDRVDTIQPTTAFMRTTPQNTDYKQFQTPWMPPGYTPPSNETISKVCQFFPVTITCFRTLYGKSCGRLRHLNGYLMVYLEECIGSRF